MLLPCLLSTIPFVKVGNHTLHPLSIMLIYSAGHQLLETRVSQSVLALVRFTNIVLQYPFSFCFFMSLSSLATFLGLPSHRPCSTDSYTQHPSQQHQRLFLSIKEVYGESGTQFNFKKWWIFEEKSIEARRIREALWCYGFVHITSSRSSDYPPD